MLTYLTSEDPAEPEFARDSIAPLMSTLFLNCHSICVDSFQDHWMTGCRQVEWHHGKSPPDLGELLAALSGLGIALLKDAVPCELAAQSLSAMTRLFDLSPSVKRAHAACNAHDPGFIAYGRHRNRKNGDPSLLESWNFRFEEALPDLIKPMATVIHRLQTLLAGHALTVLAAIERHLDVAAGSLTGSVDSQSMALTLLHYPGALLTASGRFERQFFHKDASFITLIPPTRGFGFCFLHEDQSWACEPRGGDVLILVGSSLEYVSGGVFRATEHGVTNPAAMEDRSDRYSSPLFISPSSRSKLRPLGESYSRDGTLTQAEFFNRYLPTEILANPR